jgi:phospholipase D1/2
MNKADAASFTPLLVPGRTCWRIERAARATVIVDGAAFFEAVHDAMVRARHSILIVNWDFNHRLRMVPPVDGKRIPRLDKLFRRLVRHRRRLQIHVLKWKSPLAFDFRKRTLPFQILNWLSPRRIHYRLDSNHPMTGSQHQKLVVIDDAIAFCGGMDLTDARWDTSRHLDGDPRRKGPRGEDNPPFHDLMVAVDGPAARALGNLARERWLRATGETLAPPPLGNDPWPGFRRPDFTDIDVGIARTEPQWDNRNEVREVEALNLEAIAAARQSIYIENQHFASRAIYEALRSSLERPDGPEIVVVGPEKCPGWFEEKVMGEARNQIVCRLRSIDRYNRFRIYVPQTVQGQPIVVHSKCLIVDDRLLRIGSSNFNNRSMGFDTECDLAIEAKPGDTAMRRCIATIRNGLLAEHLGVSREKFAGELADRGSLIASVERLIRDSGRTLYPLKSSEDVSPDQPIADSILDPEHPDRIGGG